MKVLIISHISFPWERGLGQLYNLLDMSGCRPCILTPKPERKEIVSHDFRVQHIGKKENNLKGYTRDLKKINVLYTYIKDTISICRSSQPDAIICRETPFAFLAYISSVVLNTPIYLDLRENRYKLYDEPSPSKSLKGYLKIPFLIALYEWILIGFFNHVFTSTEELKTWVSNNYMLEDQYISVLSNTPDYKYLNACESAIKATERDNKLIRMVFAGSIKRQKGLQDIIRSLKNKGGFKKKRRIEGNRRRSIFEEHKKYGK